MPMESNGGNGSGSLRVKALGVEALFSGPNVFLFIFILMMAAALAFMVRQSGIDHERIIRQNQALETQTRIQNWLLSMEQKDRPKLKMPVEVWGLLDEHGQQLPPGRLMPQSYGTPYSGAR